MKTFDAVVLIADGVVDREGESFAPGSVAIPEKTVRVTEDFDITKPIGRAHLSMDGDRVVATLELDCDAEGKFACAGGIVTSRTGQIIKQMTLQHIGISTANADSRVPAIGKANSEVVSKNPKDPWRAHRVKTKHRKGKQG